MIDAIGIFGVSLVVYAYFLIQTDRMSNSDIRYSLLNLVGSALIIFTLMRNFNLSSFVIEFFWVSISILGIVRYIQKRRSD